MHRLRYNIAGVLGAIVFVAIGFAALRDADALWDSWLFSLTLGLFLFAVLLAAQRTGERRAFWFGFALFGWGYLGFSLIPITEPRLIATKALSYLHQSSLFYVRAHEMRAVLSLDRMRAHNVSIADIMQALQPSGFVNEERMNFFPVKLGKATGSASQNAEPVVSWGGTRYNKPDQFGKIILKANAEGEILRLEDVAKVEIGSSFYAPRAAGSVENFLRIGHTLFALLAAWLGGVLSRRLSTIAHAVAE